MAQKAEKQLKSDENGHFSTWNGSASVPVVKKRQFFRFDDILAFDRAGL